MKKRIQILWFVLLIPTLLIGQSEKQFQVNYISSENIYLDAGKVDGLNIGDKLVVKRNNVLIAGLEIVFIAEHSASCKILNKKKDVQVGDSVFLFEKKEHKPQTSQKLENRKRVIQSKTKTKNKTQRFARISGSASVQLYRIEDLNSTKLNFNQQTFRLNFKMRNMWGKDYNFRVRTRSRYNERRRSYSSFVPRNEWRNRIYTLSFSYDNEEGPLNFKLGRIISNKFSGIGYIDGIALQGKLSEITRVGVFAGSQPEWRYSNFQPSLKKYGAYLNFVKGDYSNTRFESTLAAAGEYHGTTVSREFLYFKNSFYKTGKWNLYQSAELDINRKWRKNRTNQSMSLTNLYISANYNITDKISATLSYDNRKNYWTYETRSIADSLFDDAFRFGFRGYVNMRLAKGYSIFTNFGIRKRETDANYTYSYAGGLNNNNFLNRHIFFSFYFSGFSNYFATGFNPSIRLGKFFKGGHNINLVYGNYLYTLNSKAQNRMNQWLRLDTVIEMFYRFYVSGQYSYNWGDDSIDQRMLLELGYRF